MSKTWHSDLPWDIIKRIYRKLRRNYFSYPEPKSGYIYVECTERDIILGLGKKSYIPGEVFSFNKGEDINLRQVKPVAWQFVDAEVRDKLRPYMTAREKAQAEKGEYITWWQTHFRAWKTGEDRWKCNGHWELEPVEHDSAHIDDIGYSNKTGIKNIVRDLESADIKITEYPDKYYISD